MLGAAYTHLHDRHVRIDILSSETSRKGPVVAFYHHILRHLCSSFCRRSSLRRRWLYASHIRGHGGNIAGARGSRLCTFTRCVMPLGFIMLFLQGLAHFVRDIYQAEGGRDMSPEFVAVAMFGTLFLVLFSGHPLAFSLGGVAVFFGLIGWGGSPDQVFSHFHQQDVWRHG